MVGKTPPSIITVSPLRGGVIADFDATLAMISHYIQAVHEFGSIFPVAWARPRVVIGIPSSVTEVEKRAVWEAALSAGARESVPDRGADGGGDRRKNFGFCPDRSNDR